MHPETIDFYNQNTEKLTAQYLQADRSELQRILRQWIPPQWEGIGNWVWMWPGCCFHCIWQLKYPASGKLIIQHPLMG